MAKNTVATKALILKSALQLFMVKGYKATSYQDLMAKTGLSKGAIYHHFPSKEDILIEVFQFMYEASNQTVPVNYEDQVKDQASFIKVYLDIKRAQMDGFKKFLGVKKLDYNRFLFFFEAMNENTKLKKITAELSTYEYGFLESCFNGMKKNNKLKGKDPKALAKVLFLTLEGAGIVTMFTGNVKVDEDWFVMYETTIKDFFKLL